jgi:hypothetical protein
MSYVIAAPEMMTSAATDLDSLGSMLSEAHTLAAARTVAVLPAAADEVSAGIAHLFSAHAQEYQALAGRAAAFEEQFAQHLIASAGSFARSEAANSALLRPLAGSASSIFNPINAFVEQISNFLNAAGEMLIRWGPSVIVAMVAWPILGSIFFAWIFGAIILALFAQVLESIPGAWDLWARLGLLSL